MNDLKVYARDCIKCSGVCPNVVRSRVKRRYVHKVGIEKVIHELIKSNDITLVLDNESYTPLKEYYDTYFRLSVIQRPDASPEEDKKALLINASNTAILEMVGYDYKVSFKRLYIIMQCFFGPFLDSLMETQPIPLDESKLNIGIIIMNKMSCWEETKTNSWHETFDEEGWIPLSYTTKQLKYIRDWIANYCISNVDLIHANIKITAIHGPNKKKCMQ